MLASNRTGADTPAPPSADTAAPPGAHRDGDLAGTSTLKAPALAPTQPPRHYGNGNLAAAPASGNADSGIAAGPGSGSQGLDYDSVFFLWQNRTTGWAGARNWMKHSHTCGLDGRQRRWAPIT